MNEIWKGILIGVVVALFVSLVLWIVKPLRKCLLRIINFIWFMISYRYMVWKKINKLEKSQKEHANLIQVLMSFVTMINPSSFKQYEKILVPSLKIICSIPTKGREAEVKMILSRMISAIKLTTPFKLTPAEEINVHKSLGIIKKQSEFFVDEVEEIEKLLKSKKFAP